MKPLLALTLAIIALLLAPPVYGQCDKLAGCVLAWADEFNGTAVDPAKWEFQLGNGSTYGIPGWGNNELQWYQSDNATVAGGVLTIQARNESVSGSSYTSARVRSLGHGDFLYGRFEMRARLPVGHGMWPAFWMLPSDPSIYGVWAASGEIDIMESIGADQIYGTIHFGGTAPDNQQSGSVRSLPSGGAADLHEYAVEWEPAEIRWYLDGQLYSTKTSWFSTGGPFPAPFDVNFHLLLNLAVGGNFPGNPDGSTVFPQNFVIDYVRVYQQAPPDPEKAAACEASKAKAAARYAKCTSGVFVQAIRKAEAGDAAKLASCAEKLETAFATAEAKTAGSCPSEGDATTVGAVLDACIDDAVTSLGGVPGPGGAEARCQSAKVKESSGKYMDCRFKATSKAATNGLDSDFGRCASRLVSKWNKLEGNPARPCSTNGDLASIGSALDACHAAVAASLATAACGNDSLDIGEECDDSNTVNGDGCSASCEIEPEYTQNFEALVQASGSALADDGWWVFGNVFQAGTGNYLYGYGKFAAPNGGNAFCAIVDGQGGAEQGGQQLSVYSDYNNGDHANGHRIEANVFRERTIVADDAGKTLELSFDAKPGNIGGATTALAFIKVLNPNTGYSTTRFVSQDTTSTAAGWTSYSIGVDIDASLEGQLLQYGFSNQATHYEGSGLFYDNLVLVRRPTTP